MRGRPAADAAEAVQAGSGHPGRPGEVSQVRARPGSDSHPALPADAQDGPVRHRNLRTVHRGPAADGRQAVQARSEHRHRARPVPTLCQGREPITVEAVSADAVHRPDRHLEVPRLRHRPEADPGQAVPPRPEHPCRTRPVPALRSRRGSAADEAMPADAGHGAGRHLEVPAVRHRPEANAGQAVPPRQQHPGRPRQLPAVRAQRAAVAAEAVPADAGDRADRHLEVPALHRRPAADARQALPPRQQHPGQSRQLPAVSEGRGSLPDEAVPADAGQRADGHLEVPALRARPAADARQALPPGQRHEGRPGQVPRLRQG